jgi:hypothetical protein
MAPASARTYGYLRDILPIISRLIVDWRNELSEPDAAPIESGFSRRADIGTTNRRRDLDDAADERKGDAPGLGACGREGGV